MYCVVKGDGGEASDLVKCADYPRDRRLRAMNDDAGALHQGNAIAKVVSNMKYGRGRH